jgi:hypothetical protein
VESCNYHGHIALALRGDPLSYVIKRVVSPVMVVGEGVTVIVRETYRSFVRIVLEMAVPVLHAVHAPKRRVYDRDSSEYISYGWDPRFTLASILSFPLLKMRLLAQTVLQEATLVALGATYIGVLIPLVLVPRLLIHESLEALQHMCAVRSVARTLLNTLVHRADRDDLDEAVSDKDAVGISAEMRASARLNVRDDYDIEADSLLAYLVREEMALEPDSPQAQTLIEASRVSRALKSVGKSVRKKASSAGKSIKKRASSVGKGIKKRASSAGKAIRKRVGSIGGSVKKRASRVGDAAKKRAVALRDKVKALPGRAKKAVRRRVRKVRHAVKDRINAIRGKKPKVGSSAFRRQERRAAKKAAKQQKAATAAANKPQPKPKSDKKKKRKSLKLNVDGNVQAPNASGGGGGGGAQGGGGGSGSGSGPETDQNTGGVANNNNGNPSDGVVNAKPDARARLFRPAGGDIEDIVGSSASVMPATAVGLGAAAATSSSTTVVGPTETAFGSSGGVVQSGGFVPFGSTSETNGVTRYVPDRPDYDVRDGTVASTAFGTDKAPLASTVQYSQTAPPDLVTSESKSTSISTGPAAGSSQQKPPQLQAEKFDADLIASAQRTTGTGAPVLPQTDDASESDATSVASDGEFLIRDELGAESDGSATSYANTDASDAEEGDDEEDSSGAALIENDPRQVEFARQYDIRRDSRQNKRVESMVRRVRRICERYFDKAGITLDEEAYASLRRQLYAAQKGRPVNVYEQVPIYLEVIVEWLILHTTAPGEIAYHPKRTIPPSA